MEQLIYGKLKCENKSNETEPKKRNYVKNSKTGCQTLPNPLGNAMKMKGCAPGRSAKYRKVEKE